MRKECINIGHEGDFSELAANHVENRLVNPEGLLCSVICLGL